MGSLLGRIIAKDGVRGCPLGGPALLLLLGLLLAWSRAASADDQAGPKQPVEPRAAKAAPGGVTSLLGGKSLAGWKIVDEYDFRDHGKAYVKDGRLVLEKGDPLTGVRWTGRFPRIDYEVALDAMRIEGDDFFCSMVFPIEKQQCSITFGGWGGSIVGLTNIDGEPAVENETCIDQDFENKRWYRLRFRVTGEKIEAWVDKEKVVDFNHKDHKLDIRWEQEPILPFGISSYKTTAAVKNVTLRSLRGKKKKDSR